eukprot:SAG31_NODE_6389_length_2035_cov_1.978306_1_plen_233_part_10
MDATGPVTVGPLPRAVNNTNGPKDGLVAPQFYGGPIELPDGSLLGTVGVYWSADNPLAPTPDGPYHRMSIVAIRSADLFTWQYAGMVANASGPGGYPNSTFGPDENDLGKGCYFLVSVQLFEKCGTLIEIYMALIEKVSALIAVLADNKTLLCVIRMDGDSGCSTHSYRYYAAIRSYDLGRTWGPAVPIKGAGCARPRLLKLRGGPLVLSGGRLCVEDTDDISIWLNHDGMGE